MGRYRPAGPPSAVWGTGAVYKEPGALGSARVTLWEREQLEQGRGCQERAERKGCGAETCFSIWWRCQLGVGLCGKSRCCGGNAGPALPLQSCDYLSPWPGMAEAMVLWPRPCYGAPRASTLTEGIVGPAKSLFLVMPHGRGRTQLDSQIPGGSAGLAVRKTISCKQ